MAKNPNYNRSMVDKFSIKGILSEDGKTIEYLDGDKVESVIETARCFKPFYGQPIELTIQYKSVMDLGEDAEE